MMRTGFTLLRLKQIEELLARAENTCQSSLNVVSTNAPASADSRVDRSWFLARRRSNLALFWVSSEIRKGGGTGNGHCRQHGHESGHHGALHRGQGATHRR